MALKNKFYTAGMSSTNENVTIVIRTDAQVRFSNTCLRGTHVRKAGNFFRWRDIDELMSSYLRDDLESDVMERVEIHLQQKPNTIRHAERFEIDCEEFVGWSATDDARKYRHDELEPHRPNKRSVVQRVRLHARRRAPQTMLVTFVYELRHHINTHDWLAIVHSIYPGPDVGQLRGKRTGSVIDITRREGTVFFAYDNPGEERAPVKIASLKKSA